MEYNIKLGNSKEGDKCFVFVVAHHTHTRRQNMFCIVIRFQMDLTFDPVVNKPNTTLHGMPGGLHFNVVLTCV